MVKDKLFLFLKSQKVDVGVDKKNKKIKLLNFKKFKIWLFNKYGKCELGLNSKQLLE